MHLLGKKDTKYYVFENETPIYVRESPRALAELCLENEISLEASPLILPGQMPTLPKGYRQLSCADEKQFVERILERVPRLNSLEDAAIFARYADVITSVWVQEESIIR